MSQLIKPTDLVVTLKDGSPYVLYSPNEKQLEFHQSSIPNLVAIGSRGSGKSLMLRFDAHMRALSVPNCNVVLIRKTYPELLKSHVLHFPHEENRLCSSLKTEMELLGGTYHATDHICYYPNGSRLFLSYVGDEGDAMNLMSAEFIAAYFDEITLIPWDFITKLAASVRVSGKKTDIVPVIRAGTNPLGPSAHDIRTYFVDKAVDPEDDEEYLPDEWGHIQINMEDNPHLDVKQYRKRFAGMPEHIRKAWLEGEFADENALFSFYPTRYSEVDGEHRPYHVIKDLDPSILRTATIYRAFDMGYFPDPAVCLWIAHLGNRYVVFHEQVWYKHVVKEIAADIKEYEGELKGTAQAPGPIYGARVYITYCDPSMDVNTGADVMTIKDQFEMNGVPMEPSVNNREFYASAIHTALAEEAYPGTPRIQFYDGGKYKGCPYLVKTLPMMQFDPKHSKRMANHKQDHAAVALAYFLISFSSLDKAPTHHVRERPWMKERQVKWVLGKEAVHDR